MSKKLFLLPAIMLVAAVMFVSSCGKDCSFTSDDYAGQYSVVEDCSASAASAYNVTVTKGATDTDLKMANVWNLFVAAVNATTSCETITIPRQEPDGDKFFIEGSGFIEKKNGTTTITMSYTVSDETDAANIKKDECTQTIYTKL